MSELSPEASELLRDARRAFEPDPRSLRDAHAALHEKLQLGAASILDQSELENSLPRALPTAPGLAARVGARALGRSSTLALKGGLAALVTLTVAALLFGRHQLGRHQLPSPPLGESVVSPSPTLRAPAPGRASIAAPREAGTPTFGRAKEGALRLREHASSGPALTVHHKAKSAIAARAAARHNALPKQTPNEPAIASKPDVVRTVRDAGASALTVWHETVQATEPGTPDQAAKRGSGFSGAPRRWSISSLQRAGRQSSREQKAAGVQEPTPQPIDTDSLEREIEYLRKARAALQKNDSKLALALLREHQARYPSGALREERLATEVLAFCLARQSEQARASLQRLARIAPASPYLAQLARSCASD